MTVSGDPVDRIVVDPRGRRPAVLGVRVRALMTGRAKGYIVADDGPAMVASLNFTRKCFESPCDFVLVSRDPSLASALGSAFDSDWSGEAAQTIRLVDPKVSDPVMLLLRGAVRDRASLDILDRFWTSLPRADAAVPANGMPMELS
jgi:hypothetical protein